jgi:clumping factor B
VSNPLHGTLSEINQNTGVVTYTSKPGFVGTDKFTFKVNDGTVDSSNVGTVRIQVPIKETTLH